ncbi:unnamed protein product [Paramecium primaurelia]|uniref:Cation-transporting P-type ATPase C-terminal domain-containing protein n=1 Tax=Paramecium primaurelia TaxID=5886 RepID=A0A8S1K006_PARPR|nr:unnamed protein product [Paramecium primaurelia]
MDKQPLLHKFTITPNELFQIISSQNTQYTATSLSKMLDMDLQIGLDSSNVLDINKRKKQFGTHKIYDSQTIRYQLVIQIIKNKWHQIFFAITLIKLGLSMLITNSKNERMESLFILVFSLLQLLIRIFKTDNQELLNNLRQFQNNKVKLKRNDKVINISSEQIVVGDILIFCEDQLIEVDGILISNQTNQTILFDTNTNKLPFIRSGSKVLQGNGQLLVLAVGINTYHMRKCDLNLQHEYTTPLQERLNYLQQQLIKLFFVLAIIPLIIQFLNYCYHISTQEYLFDFVDSIHSILKQCQISILLLLMVMNDNLSKFVSTYLQYNQKRMKRDRIKFQRPSSCEILGRINNICTSKSQILTNGNTRLVQIFAEEQLLMKFDIKKLRYSTIQLIQENICLNSTANPKISYRSNDITVFEKFGNEIDCALLEYCHELGLDYTTIRKSYQNQIVQYFQFNSDRKMMSVLIKLQNKYILYTKGAPEIILEYCTDFINSKGEIQKLTEQSKQQIYNQIKKFGEESYRPLCFAYKNIDININLKLLSEKQLEKQLIFVALIALEDEIRQGVQRSIQQCKEAGVIVRMITNESLECSISLSKKCGILPMNYQHQKDSRKVMTGKTFNDLVKGITYKKQDGQIIPKIGDMDSFAQIAAELRVLVRASLDEKLAIIQGLKELNYVVGVFSHSNEPAFYRLADVGFCQNSKIIQQYNYMISVSILDDNFSSVIYSIDWGRNIFDAVRKFIQFKIALLLSLSILQTFSIFHYFNQTQLLWITFIVDFTAFFMYATEIPSRRLYERQQNERYHLITSNMWRNILSQIIYQLLVLFMIQVATQKYIEMKNSQNCYHFDLKSHTLLFNTFVYLQIFNLMISHKIRKTDICISSNKREKAKLIIQLLLIFVMQYLVVEHCNFIFNLSKLTMKEYFGTLLLSSFGCVVTYLFKFINDKYFNWIMLFRSQDQRNHYSSFDEFLQFKSILRQIKSYPTEKEDNSEIELTEKQ